MAVVIVLVKVMIWILGVRLLVMMTALVVVMLALVVAAELVVSIMEDMVRATVVVQVLGLMITPKGGEGGAGDDDVGDRGKDDWACHHEVGVWQ